MKNAWTLASADTRKVQQCVSRKTTTMYRGAHGNVGKEREQDSKTLSVSTLTLGETSPLGLSKLGSILGSIERVFGLSIASG